MVSVLLDSPCGNCGVAHSDPGCEMPTMEACVCAFDPHCCEVEWDRTCAALAHEECGCGMNIVLAHFEKSIWKALLFQISKLFWISRVKEFIFHQICVLCPQFRFFRDLLGFSGKRISQPKKFRKIPHNNCDEYNALWRHAEHSEIWHMLEILRISAEKSSRGSDYRKKLFFEFCIKFCQQIGVSQTGFISQKVKGWISPLIALRTSRKTSKSSNSACDTQNPKIAWLKIFEHTNSMEFRK